MISIQDIYDKTNNGLDIILDFLPQAREALTSTNKHFRVRASDKTPSAALFLKKEKDGTEVWKVKDFGDGPAMSAIDICMQDLGIKFTEAIYYLAEKYHVTETELIAEVNKPDIRKNPAKEDEPDGSYYFKKKEKFTPDELKLLGPHVKQKDCDALGYFSLEHYRLTKKGTSIVFYSKDTYPIFMRECKYKDRNGADQTFYKIYKPLEPQKQYRFLHFGNKPEQYIHGLKELKEKYDRFKVEQEKTDEYKKAKEDDKPFNYEKLDEAFIVSGERDALCIQAFSFTPLWFNAEGYNLSEWELKEIQKYVKKIYYIPDLDERGIEYAKKMILKHIDLYTIWLPAKLRTYRDNRHRPRKDFRDYCEIYPDKSDFTKLFNLAMPVRFWEYTDDGKGRKRLDINAEYVTYFLRCNGYVSLENKNAKTGSMLARIKGDVVEEIKLKDVKAFLKQFVWDRHLPVEIRNLVRNSTRLSESNLDLDEVQLSFKDYTPTSQFFFFRNTVWEVTGKDIKEYSPGNSGRHVWKDELIDHHVKRMEPAFKINKVAQDNEISGEEDNSILWDISVNPEQSSKFFQYLINTSRIFWRKEFEPENDVYPHLPDITPEEYRKKYHFAIDGPALNKSEISEQKLHLINKIFCLGYLFHRYKAEDKGWAVYCMDNKIGDNDESNGGSGKSFYAKAPMLFMKSEILPGRDPKMIENPHLLGNVTEHTDYILVDDAHAYLAFDSFYDRITTALTVNPKFNAAYTIPYALFPKWCFTTNFTNRNMSPSTARRLLYAVFSDYYHQQTDTNGYLETRKIKDDFNKNLFDEFYSGDEWNADLNFFVDCTQFYLSVVEQTGMIQPPMSNVLSRTYLALMGEPFFNWAEVYFSEGSGNTDRLIPRDDAFTDFKTISKINSWTTQKFSSSLKYYCLNSSRVIELNPTELKNNGGRIIKKHQGKSTEMIYVRTTDSINFAEADNYENKNNQSGTDDAGGTSPLPF